MNLSRRITTAPLVQKLLGVSIAQYLRLVWKTCSFTIDPPDFYDRAEVPFIVAMWHGQRKGISICFGGPAIGFNFYGLSLLRYSRSKSILRILRIGWWTCAGLTGTSRRITIFCGWRASSGPTWAGHGMAGASCSGLVHRRSPERRTIPNFSGFMAIRSASFVLPIAADRMVGCRCCDRPTGCPHGHGVSRFVRACGHHHVACCGIRRSCRLAANRRTTARNPALQFLDGLAEVCPRPTDLARSCPSMLGRGVWSPSPRPTRRMSWRSSATVPAASSHRRS